MSTKKKEKPLIIARHMRVLSCSQCGRSITVRASEDPKEGDGWPLHRCGREIRAFNKQEIPV